MKSLADPREIAIAAYRYDLPEERIAQFPQSERDASRLLIYKEGVICQHRYSQLADYLPPHHLLVLNNTKVVEARLLFTKATGGTIEIFCLEPHPQYADISTAMSQTGSVQWTCLVGGAAKWKAGSTLEKKLKYNGKEFCLTASMLSKDAASYTIQLAWDLAELSFADILHIGGIVPIPPYLNRPSSATDAERYQTIYAAPEGSVAAPTAGLHFTEKLFNDLRNKQIDTSFLTLHVGAATFKPVKTERIADHIMHTEFINISRSTLTDLIAYKGRVIAVGTTSFRTLESLYWMGVKATLNPNKKLQELAIEQWEVYDELIRYTLPLDDALKTLLQRMDAERAERLISKTQILIVPGYPVKMIKGLITNFHQPQSTLLLLVAALVGEDWKKIYQYALENDFRFLSYGDGSLLWKKDT